MYHTEYKCDDHGYKTFGVRTMFRERQLFNGCINLFDLYIHCIYVYTPLITYIDEHDIFKKKTKSPPPLVSLII